MSKPYLQDSIQEFIDNLHIKPYKAPDFQSLIEKIDESYINKNEKAEKYFIKHIAHAYNKRANIPLIDYSNSNIDLSKNYNNIINKNIISQIVDSGSDEEVISLSKNLQTYKHTGNTEFLEQKDITYSFKKLAKVKYLDYKNQHKTPIMLTLTLDKSFRKYIKVSDTTLGEYKGLKEINDEANLQELIEKSYHTLNKRFRNMYRYFKNLNYKANDSDNLDYIMIFEPHKSLTLHLHILFYCNKIQHQNLKRVWDNYIKSLTPTQQKAQDFKVIDIKIAKASTYLSKYLIKAYNNTQEQENNMFFSKFKRYFSRYRLFRTSNFYNTTQAKIDKMYSYMRTTYPDILKRMKMYDIPLYIILEKMEVDELFMFEESKEESKRLDKKAIEDFYHINKEELNDESLKEEIKNNINMFYKSEVVSKITKAVFIIDDDKMVNLLSEFQINTQNIESIESDKKFDVFYREGMYILHSTNKCNRSNDRIEVNCSKI